MELSSGKVKTVILGVMTLLLVSTVSSAAVQNHPFSEIFPPDTNLGFGQYNIENVSRVELTDIVPDGTDIVFRDSGDTPTLIWDESEGEWRLNGINLNASGNDVTNLGSIDGGTSAINVNNVLAMNSNSINGLNNLGFNGGTTYIIQNSNGKNIFVQADDSSGNRNNYLRVDPDNQLTAFPTGNVRVVNGNLDLNSNSLTNFFGSPCPSGEVIADINDDGTFQCVSMSDEVSSDYVARKGDSMTGNLDMTGNNILDTGDLGVGTGNPSHNEIHIDGGGSYNGMFIQDPSASSDFGGKIVFNDNQNELGLMVRDSGSDTVGLGIDRQTSNVRIPSGNLNIGGNSITNFFGSACPSGEAMVDVNDDGTYQCTDISGEVSGDYVSRDGDSMTGNLDITGNNILDIGDLTGSNIVNSGNINNGAVTSSELGSNAVTSSGGELDSSVAGGFLGYNSGALNVQSSSISWSDLGITQSDVSVSDLGAADANFDVNGNSILNYFGSPCPSGEAMVDVNSDGSFQCTDVSNEVSGDYVSRSGDSMTGNLDMNNNNIVGSNQIKADRLRVKGNSPARLEGFAVDFEHPTDSFGISRTNNVLAFAHEKFTVTQPTGPSPAGSIEGPFKLHGTHDTRWSSGDGPVVIEVGDLPDEHKRQAFMTFNWGRYPGYIEVQGWDSSNSAWSTLDEVSDNSQDNVHFNLGNYKTTKLRFKFDNFGVNSNNEMAVQKIAVTSETHRGSAFLDLGGGSLYGDLNMNSNRINNPSDVKFDDASNSGRNWVIEEDSSTSKLTLRSNSDDRLRISEGGSVEIPTGNLNMNNNNVKDINLMSINDPGVDGRIDWGANQRIYSAPLDGSNSRGPLQYHSGSYGHAFRDGSVQILDGELDMNGNSIVNYYGSACPSGETMVDVNDDGSFTCTDISNEVSGDYVSRTGDSMTGNLDMSGNNVDNVDTVNSGGSTLNVGGDVAGSGTVKAGGSLETDSGTVTTSGTGMCIGDQCQS